MLWVLRVLRVRMELRVCVGVGVRVVVHRVLGWDGVERKIDKEGEEEEEGEGRAERRGRERMDGDGDGDCKGVYGSRDRLRSSGRRDEQERRW